MKAMLISTSPEHCELIANHKKTIIIRKNKPKLETPFKVYIYCTKGNDLNYLRTFVDSNLNQFKFWIDNKAFGCNVAKANGKVIGEFICDEIINVSNKDLRENFRRLMRNILIPSCLNPDELKEYLGFKNGLGLHISNLKIYDKPKELSEFRHYKKFDWWDYGHHTNKPQWELCSLTRPPQSWCYVEELVGDYE